MSRRATTRLAAAAVALGLSLLPAGALGQALPSAFASAARFDAMRRVAGTIAPDPDGAGPLRFAAVRNTYDEAGRLVKVEKGELAAWQSEAVAPKDWESYTSFTIFTQVDTAYDSMGRKVREAVSGGGMTFAVTEYDYDLAGRLKCTAVRMNPEAGAVPLADKCVPGPVHAAYGADRITRNSYDPRGQLLKVEKGVGTELRQDYATYTWSDNGRQTSVTDANGNRAEMNYDGLDRQTRWTFPSPSSPGVANPSDYEEYGYDPNANRTSLRKRDGSVLTFDYDALSRVTHKIVPERSGLTAAQTRDVYYAYDNRGLQTGAWFDAPGGEGIANAYDGFGALVASTSTMGGVTRTLASVWNEDGGRTSLSLTAGGGYYAGYAYDGLDRMIRVTEPGDYPVTTFAYRPDGRRGAMAQGPGTATSSSAWDYDEAGRLKALTHDLAGTTSDQALAFTYNPASQMVTRTSANPLYKWTPPYAVERSYAVNGLNQYQSTTGTKAATFAYDANGNLTQTASVEDGTTDLLYDVENRLVRARGARNADLTYDPLGRLWKVEGGATGTRTFLHDGDAIIAEFDSTGAMTDAYVHGDGEDDPLVWHHLADGPSGARKFLKANHQGSIIAIAGNDGAATAINSYDPWGVPGSANQGLFQYTGQVWLPELGMYYYKARIYWATLGRFLQTDPIGYDDQVNLYAYVGNDPIDMSDTTGMAGGSDHYEDVMAGRVPAAVTPAQASAIGDLEANLLDGVSELLNSQPELGGPEAGGFFSAAAGSLRNMSREARALEAAEAAAERASQRASSLAKGVPESRIGGSGRPVQHTIVHSSRKAAREAAERDAPRGGTARNDAHPTNPKQKAHFQAEGPNQAKVHPTVHHEYPERQR